MARAHKAGLIMLHVFDVPTSWNYPHAKTAHDMESEAIKESEDRLKELYDKYAKDVPAEFMAVENISIAKGLESVVKVKDPSLIVIGTKGGSKIKEVIVGSTTRALVKHASVPILSIPWDARVSDFKRVLFTTDFYEEDILALGQLIEFMRPFDPEISVVHVSTDKEYRADEKMEWFRGLVEEQVTYAGLTFEVLSGENIFDRLSMYMVENPFDLLVMYEKEREGFIDILFHQDLVREMEFHTSMPLLSFNEHCLSFANEEKTRKEVQNK
jgi:nucleotide-binding universal stress UspA family protein